MKLRALVVALLIANVGYFAWTRGALALFGTVPAKMSETEPHRLAQQIRPQLLEIRTDPAATRP